MLEETDPNLSKRDSRELRDNSARNVREMTNGFSFSGNERDHLFLNLSGEQFHDIAGISGLADPADGRVVAILDIDRDGWRDFAVTNANAPVLRLHRNQIASRGAAAAKGGIVALRFVGGNTTASSSKSSNRDGYGARVTVALTDMSLVREHRASEGFSAQNSSTMIVGVGKHDTSKVSVRFPSGVTHELSDVATGSLLTVYETPSASPTGEAFVVEPYVRHTSTAKVDVADNRRRLATFAPEPPGDARPKLIVYTTMATWCAACKREIPQVARLREQFTGNQVALRGLPTDVENDDEDALAEYIAKYKPAYTVLAKRSPEQVKEIEALLLETLNLTALPATVITNADAVVVATMFGVPSTSDLKRLLDLE